MVVVELKSHKWSWPKEPKSHKRSPKSHKLNRELEDREVSQTVPRVFRNCLPEVSQTVVVELRSLTNGSVRTQVSQTEVTNCEVSQTNSSHWGYMHMNHRRDNRCYGTVTARSGYTPLT